MPVKYGCVACRKEVTATKNDRYRSHTDGNGEPCPMSSDQIPEHVLANPVAPGADPSVPQDGVDYATCALCDRKVKLTRLGYFEPHDKTLRGADRCPNGGVRAIHGKKTDILPLPGDTVPEKGLYAAQVPAVSNQKEVEAARVTAPTESTEGGPLAEGAATASEAASTNEIDVGARNLIRQPMAESTPEPASLESVSEPWVAQSATGAGSGVSTESSSPELSTTSSPSPPPESVAVDVTEYRWGPRLSETIQQPGTPFQQPVEYTGPVKPEPMGDKAQTLATMIKETFYSFSNRRTTDNRSAQKTLGPSEVGTPCDRRLAMELMDIPPVNAGGDGWAAFAGTCIHTGMAEIYTWADAGTGRYAVEFPVKTPSPWVPKGTSDMLDRRINTIVDWKMMGSYSLNKFKLEGPSETYQVQGQVYGLGAELQGEKVTDVAIVGMPRAGSSLDEMHVHVMPYDRKRAQAALARVDRIAAEVQSMNTWAGLDVHNGSMRKAREFSTGNDCRYCSFYLKGDKDMQKGCPGV